MISTLLIHAGNTRREASCDDAALAHLRMRDVVQVDGDWYVVTGRQFHLHSAARGLQLGLQLTLHACAPPPGD